MFAFCGGGGYDYQPVDASVKTACLNLEAQAGYALANSFWAAVGRYIKRTNRAYLQWDGWKLPWVRFDAECTPASFSDLRFGVFVDNVLVKTVQGVGDGVRREYWVPITPLASGSRIRVEEPWDTVTGAQNRGADEAVEGGYITGAWVPYGTRLTKKRASRALLVDANSILGARLSSSYENLGPVGKLRQIGDPRGWITMSLDHGGLCGADLSAANRIALLLAAAADTGASQISVLLEIWRNDWADYGAIVSTSTAAAVAYTNTVIAGLPAAWTKVVLLPITQASEVDHGGGTLPAWRTALAAGIVGTNVVIVDGNTLGLVPATHEPDGVHTNDAGGDLIVAGVRNQLGLA
jgi:hypothetical protein